MGESRSAIKVLVVDDEPQIVRALRINLAARGYNVVTAATGTGALRAIASEHPDVVILDVMLPDIDGLTVLSRLRSEGDQVPVLFLTAKDAVDDRVAGLTVGGDDYVTKPFSLEELVARLRALLRRSTMLAAAGPDPIIRVGDLALDEESYEVRRAGTLIELTATEFELLRFLMRNPRRVLSKAQILDRVWGYDYEGDIRVVDTTIKRLRKKMNEKGECIQTVRGLGYKFKE